MVSNYMYCRECLNSSNQNVVIVIDNEPVSELTNVEMRVAKTIMGLIGAWTVAWTPYTVVSFIGICGYGHLLTVVDL